MDLGIIHQRVSRMADRMGHTILPLDSLRRVPLEVGGKADQARDEFQTLLSMDNSITNGYQDLDDRANHVKHQYSALREAQVEISPDKRQITYEESFNGKRGLMESFDLHDNGITWCTVTENNGRLSAEIFSTPDSSGSGGTFETWYLSGR